MAKDRSGWIAAAEIVIIAVGQWLSTKNDRRKT